MLSASFLSLALATVSGVSALPTLRVRQDPCAGIGAGAFNSANNFTLAALNSTITDSQAVGVQLVVGQNGATDSQSFGVLSTYASYQYNEYPNFSLQDGALIPNAASSSPPGADTDVSDGAMPGFVFSSSSLPAGAQIYCGVADTDPDQGSPNPLLAVHGNTDSFSLCMGGSGSTAQNNIVYNAASGSESYDYTTCYPVKVQMLGTD